MKQETKRGNRVVSLLLAVLLLVLMLPMTAVAEEGVYLVSSEEEFRAALEKLTGSDSWITVTLKNDITISSDLSVNQGTLTILGQDILGQEHTLSFNNGSLIIGGSATVNLGAEDGSDTLILTSTDSTRCVVGMNGSSTLNMYEGVTIKDSRSGGQAGGVQLEDQAVFNMHGGVIDNCVNWDSVAGGVVIAGAATFNMYNGIIQNCSGYQGGGVGVYGNGTFVMKDGGEISNCTDHYYGGGGVHVIGNGANFTMNDGSITGCNADKYGYGGAVFVYGKATFNSGSIKDNSTVGYGGGVFVYAGTATIADGVALYNNTATEAGDDLYNNEGIIILGTTGSGLTLSSCGHTVDGWYYDGGSDGATRWSSIECSEGAEDHMIAYNEDMIGVPNSAECGLKAAHGELPVQHTVTYTDGVEGEEIFPDETYTVTAGSALPSFAGSTERQGYTFTGWTPVLADTVTEDVTYTAQWQKNGGSVIIIESEEPNPPTGDAGSRAAWGLLLVSGTVLAGEVLLARKRRKAE